MHPTWREFVGRWDLGLDREEQLAYVAQWEKSRRRLRLGG
jgi:hypothetical protein